TSRHLLIAVVLCLSTYGLFSSYSRYIEDCTVLFKVPAFVRELSTVELPSDFTPQMVDLR
ncbi:hypothetical protein AAVH_10837, partial [Aphelenchoides avenae]